MAVTLFAEDTQGYRELNIQLSDGESLGLVPETPPSTWLVPGMNNRTVAETGSKVAHAALQSVMNEWVESRKEPEIQHKTFTDWTNLCHILASPRLGTFSRGRKMLEIAGSWINNIYRLAHTPLYVFRRNCQLNGKNRRRNTSLKKETEMQFSFLLPGHKIQKRLA